MNINPLRLAQLALVAALGAAVACGSSGGTGDGIADDDGSSGHNCTLIRANANWHGHFVVYHNDPTSCPKDIDAGATVEAGGTVVETTGQSAFLDILSVYPTNAQCSEQAFGQYVAQDEESFSWGDYREDGTPVWARSTGWISQREPAVTQTAIARFSKYICTKWNTLRQSRVSITIWSTSVLRSEIQA